MKKLILFVLSMVFLTACTGMEKRDEPDIKTMVWGKTYHMEETVDENIVDITFGEDTLYGNTGMNDYYAPYMIKGNKINIKFVGIEGSMGRMSGIAFEELEKQDREFIKVLEEAVEINFVEGKLLITGASGREMTFVEKIKTALEEQMAGKTFVFEDSLPNHKITIKFFDGTLGGTSGVNKYTAAYELEGDKLTISPQILTTMMAGPEDAMNKESEYLTDLSRAEKAEYIDGKLVITIKGGKQLIFK